MEVRSSEESITATPTSQSPRQNHIALSSPPIGSISEKDHVSNGEVFEMSSTTPSSVLSSPTSSRSNLLPRLQPPGKFSENRASDRFDPDLVYKVVEAMIADRIRSITYEPFTCKRVSQSLSSDIVERLKALRYPGYRFVALTSVGSTETIKGLQFGSRSLWSPATDHFVDVKYSNGSIFVVALVYALYGV